MRKQQLIYKTYQKKDKDHILRSQNVDIKKKETVLESKKSSQPQRKLQAQNDLSLDPEYQIKKGELIR